MAGPVGYPCRTSARLIERPPFVQGGRWCSCEQPRSPVDASVGHLVAVANGGGNGVVLDLAAMVHFRLNGTAVSADVPPDMPLLWVLRDVLGFTGTKYGCGIAVCGACTVHIDGKAARACAVPAASVEGLAVTTIEGMGTPERLHPVQQAWVDEQVPQCGYCQPGMIMAAAALLRETPAPTDEQVDAVMSELVCRCGTYGRMREAIRLAAAAMGRR